jgi:hypothetical protein
MLITEVEARLKTLLRDGGFDFRNPDPELAWSIFKSFVQEPVECADDGILFQCGVYEWTGEPQFEFDFTRQFSTDDEDGEYEGMEQLHCKFSCDPDEELQELNTNLWAYDFATLDEYFEAVQALKEFQVATSRHKWNCEVTQGKV